MFFYADNDYYLSKCEQVMHESGTMDQTIMHCIFVGPAGVGKSSLLKRLLRKKLVSKRTSTQAAEKSVQVEIIRDVTISISQASLLIGQLSTNIGDPASSGQLTLKPKKQIQDPLTRSPEPSFTIQEVIKEYHPTTHDQKREIPEQKGQVLVSKEQSSESPQVHSPAEVTISSESITSKSSHSNFNMSLDFFRHVLKEEGVSGLKKHLDNRWTLYLTDSGGQPEFQELLPALVVGPCVFFIVLPLNRDLNMKYEVEYVRPDEQKYMRKYLSSLTVQEDLLRSLASIASTEYKDKDGIEVKPRVILVATFKDKVTKEECQKTLDSIKALVTKTDVYRQGMIVDASETQMVFTINNASDVESEKDAQKIRDAFQKIADGFKVCTPAPWLIFSILLQYMSEKGDVVSKSECFAVAQECGIKSPSEFEAALQFLHKQSGVLHYYMEPSELNQIVLRNPQHLFSRVNELVEKTFTFKVTQTNQCTDDFKRGIFRRTDYERYTLAKESSSNKMTPTMLLKLLEHLNVVVSLDSGEKYFMPCAIAHLEPADIGLLPQPSPIPPLLITFKSGYCPKGLFGSLVACIANKQVENSTLDLDQSKINRDQICFAMGQCILLLRVKATCIYIEVSPCNPDVPLSTLCNNVRKLIFDNIERACKALHYSLTPNKHYFLSFEGWCDQCEKLHPVALQPVLNVDHLKVDLFQCNQSQKAVKPSLQLYVWLPEVSRQQHGAY